MKIKILKTILLTTGVFKSGEVVNLSDSAALELVNAGYATLKLEERKQSPKESKVQEKTQAAETEEPKAQAAETEKPKAQETEVKHVSKAGNTPQRAKAAPKS